MPGSARLVASIAIAGQRSSQCERSSDASSASSLHGCAAMARALRNVDVMAH
jgi:hypothetical protein